MDKQISDSVGILDLPCETLILIFEYLSFEEVAKSRVICKRIDDICQKILNRGFKRAAHQSAMAYKRIKSLLPRRESERRNHALVRHADILSSVETRLSMLSMTYTKYIDLNMCCFIPGRVLDEIFHILRLTKQRCVSLRPLEILQEFRDISSMAIEHFDEHIASEYKRTLERNTLLKVHSGSPDNMHTSESECGASELLWVRKYARTGFVTPLSTIRLPDKVQTTVLPSTIEPLIGLKTCAKAQYKRERGKDFVIKKLEKTIVGLEKKQIKQHKYYKRELYRLSRNFFLTKRRLDEMDSKYKELIETVRQYNLEPTTTSQQSTGGSSSSNLNTSNSTDDTITNAEDDATKERVLNEDDSKAVNNAVAVNVNDDKIDADAATVSTESSATTTTTTTANLNVVDKARSIKRPWMSDVTNAYSTEILNKKKRRSESDGVQ